MATQAPSNPEPSQAPAENSEDSGVNRSSSKPLTIEPPKETNATTLDVSSGKGVKLNHLGPMIVNRDGTLSRISNWEQMSDIERQNTVRILGKRNQLRMDALRDEDATKESGA